MTRVASNSKTDLPCRWFRGLRGALSSLQFKASLLVILVVLVVIIGGLQLGLRKVTALAYEQAKTSAYNWAQVLASMSSEYVQTHQREALVHAINDSMRTNSVLYMSFTDEKGQLLAQGELYDGLLENLQVDESSDVFKELPPSLRMPDFQHDSKYLAMIVPVYGDHPIPGASSIERKVVGHLHLAIKPNHIQARIGQAREHFTQIAMCVLMFIAIGSVMAMRKVVSPLNELARTARQLAGGVMDARAKVVANNEIGELAYAFNEMADRLAGTQFEMLRLNSELEERVQQRTYQLEDLASRDALTGLHNRRLFSDIIAREFAAAERYDTDLTCLMFDLDHFKETNDKFGHRMGDEVLCMVAESIRNELRDSDVAARFGGDEFILLLPRTSGAAAANLADRIVSRFSEEVRRHSANIPATLSIGVASLRVTRARSAEMLIHEADLALYAAKTAGRNCMISARSKPATASVADASV